LSGLTDQVFGIAPRETQGMQGPSPWPADCVSRAEDSSATIRMKRRRRAGASLVAGDGRWISSSCHPSDCVPILCRHAPRAPVVMSQIGGAAWARMRRPCLHRAMQDTKVCNELQRRERSRPGPSKTQHPVLRKCQTGDRDQQIQVMCSCLCSTQILTESSTFHTLHL
jgi:hypothetical protein